MPDPGNRKRPAADRALSGGHQGDDYLHSISDPLEELRCGMFAAFVDCCLISRATVILDNRIEPDCIPDVLDRWVYAAVLATATGFTDPNPLSVVETARQIGMEIPPAWLGTPISAVAARAARAYPPSSLPYLATKVREFAGRQAVQTAAERIVSACWVGDITDLHTTITAQINVITTAIEAVNG